MLKLIFTKFWPIFIVLAIYLIWYVFILPKVKDNLPERKKKSYYILAVAIILSLIFSLLLFFVTESKPSRYYVPAQIEGGKIKPAEIK